MGYDGGIIIMKKKLLEKAKHLFPGTETYSFSELYENCLYMWEHPENYYGLQEDEKSIGVDVLDENIFDDFLGGNLLKMVNIDLFQRVFMMIF